MSTVEPEGPPDERRMLDALARVPPPAWQALFRAADAVAAEEVHATWEAAGPAGTTVVDGEERPVLTMPYPVYSEAVETLRAAIGSAAGSSTNRPEPPPPGPDRQGAVVPPP